MVRVAGEDNIIMLSENVYPVVLFDICVSRHAVLLLRTELRPVGIGLNSSEVYDAH